MDVAPLRTIVDDGVAPRRPRDVADAGRKRIEDRVERVDRFLVAAGYAPTTIINFDGGAPKAHFGGLHQQTKCFLPPDQSLAACRMLLLDRRSPSNFPLTARSDTFWTMAQTDLQTVSFRRIAHLDIISPPAIRACADAISRFIEDGNAGQTDVAGGLSFDTIGGALFQILDSADEPDAHAVRALLNGNVPKDGVVRLALLVLALATSETNMALDYARRIIADEPGHRAARYAEVALLSEAGRHQEACAVAESWCQVHTSDRNMLKRARLERCEARTWPSAKCLRLGSDVSLDFALQVRAGHRTTFC